MLRESTRIKKRERNQKDWLNKRICIVPVYRFFLKQTQNTIETVGSKELLSDVMFPTCSAIQIWRERDPKVSRLLFKRLKVN